MPARCTARWGDDMAGSVKCGIWNLVRSRSLARALPLAYDPAVPDQEPSSPAADEIDEGSTPIFRALSPWNFPDHFGFRRSSSPGHRPAGRGGGSDRPGGRAWAHRWTGPGRGPSGVRGGLGGHCRFLPPGRPRAGRGGGERLVRPERRRVGAGAPRGGRSRDGGRRDRLHDLPLGVHHQDADGDRHPPAAGPGNTLAGRRRGPLDPGAPGGARPVRSDRRGDDPPAP
jgi:hypothetical protein